MLEVRRVSGIVQKVPNPIAVRMFTFKHAPARDEACSCEAAAKNALSKADVIL